MDVTLQKPIIVVKPRRPRIKLGKLTFGKVLSLLLLLAISFLFIVPFLWMLSTSLKDVNDLAGNHWIPVRIAWENYKDAFTVGYGLWPRWTLNTFVITISAVIGQVLSSSLVAYAFARLRWHGRDTVFSLVLATMMLPGVVTMIPQYILWAKLPTLIPWAKIHFIDTFWPLIIPAFTGSAFYIFLLRQFMRSIPMELSEAARIDGASELRIWWSVVLPLTKPAVATVAIFTFQGAWQDFMGPLLYLTTEKNYTLQLGLRQFEAAAGGSPAWNWLMAASLLVMLPVLLVFVMFQQYFIEGISFSGMGGR